MSVPLSASTAADPVAFVPAPVQVKPEGEPLPLVPAPKSSFRDLGVTPAHLQGLIVKSLYLNGPASSQGLATQVKLTVSVVRELLDELRRDLLIVPKGTAELVDFIFQLTDTGVRHAKNLCEKSTYCGSAPVPLEDYVESVELQSIRSQPLDLQKYKTVFEDLYIPAEQFNELAQAMHAGRGVFIFGAPGNGKTTIAERLTACFSKYMWIPRTLIAGHEIIRLFDSSVHKQVDPNSLGYEFDRDEIDHRWVLIERPSIVVGGELTMDNLEIGCRDGSSVLEAPIQMKSNGGTLVIDDFGRQRISATDLLNRWIVPLNQYKDYLILPNGRQIQVPFDQNIVFATNIRPKELVDEAFLRRIPFKVELVDPDEKAFRQVFAAVAKSKQLTYDESILDHLFEKHYRQCERPFRYCHPADLLFHVENLCELFELPREVTKSNIDIAAKNYFGGL